MLMVKKHFLFLVVILIILVSFFWVIFIKPSPAHGIFYKNTVINKNKVEDGYLLFSPFLAKSYSKDQGEVFLTDLQGNIVHKWVTKYSTLYAFVTPEKNLYTAQITPSNLTEAPGGGKTGLLQKIDSKGNVLWEFSDDYLHHDFDVDLESGTVYAILFSPLSKGFSERIVGGQKTSREVFWSDTIIALDKYGKVVWDWKLEDHINPKNYPLASVTPRNDFSHSNSVKFYKTNPINNKPALLISVRHINTVFLIDRESGLILWESPKKVFNYQHDATLTASGTILVFDNGFLRESERPFLWSRLVEVDIKTNKIVWQFKAGETGPELASFAASILSGAQRLPNGNTLGVDGPRGHIFEVTKEGEVVFSFVNPYFTKTSTNPFGNNVLFKARKIPKDYFKI